MRFLFIVNNFLANALIIYTKNIKKVATQVKGKSVDVDKVEDLADEIFVINKNGYIGSSTRSEIEYAKSKEMPITYMECPNEDYIS